MLVIFMLFHVQYQRFLAFPVFAADRTWKAELFVCVVLVFRFAVSRMLEEGFLGGAGVRTHWASIFFSRISERWKKSFNTIHLLSTWTNTKIVSNKKFKEENQHYIIICSQKKNNRFKVQVWCNINLFKQQSQMSWMRFDWLQEVWNSFLTDFTTYDWLWLIFGWTRLWLFQFVT